MMNYEVTEIAELKEFEKLEAEWNNLLSQSHCNVPFLRHEWFINWWISFGEKNRLAIISVRKDGELVCAFPLMEVRTQFALVPFVILQSMTNYHSFRYHFLLKSGGEGALQAVWDYLCRRPRRWDLLQLQEIPADNPIYSVLSDMAEKDLLNTEVWESGNSPYLRIEGSWDAHWESLKSKFRANMRSRTKRLQQLGNVEHEVITDPSTVRTALPDAFAIEQKSWKGENGTAIACNPALVNFYTRWADIAASMGLLQLSFLKVNGRRVACDYSVVYENNLYCMKIGCDQEFRPYSVGQMLCLEIIRSCFDKKLEEYDFLGEMTDQKLDWSPSIRKHVWLFVYNRTIPSYIHYNYKFRLKRKIKQWRQWNF